MGEGDIDNATKEAASACKNSVVELERTVALVLLIINCIPFTSGVGTMVSACVGENFNCNALVFGLLQFLLAWILIGWIWSIVHGIWLLDAAKADKK